MPLQREEAEAVVEMHELVSPLISDFVSKLPLPEADRPSCFYLGVITALLTEAAMRTMALQDVDPAASKNRDVAKKMFIRLAKDIWNDNLMPGK